MLGKSENHGSLLTCHHAATLTLLPFDFLSKYSHTGFNGKLFFITSSLPMLPVSSRNTGNEDYEPELVELLRAMECPVCRGIPNPPIYNCVNGHFSCASCRPRLPLQRCAYCNAKFTKMRNYPLENLVSAPVFLCDFRRAGCKVRDMNMIEYEEHMRKCWYRSL